MRKAAAEYLNRSLSLCESNDPHLQQVLQRNEGAILVVFQKSMDGPLCQKEAHFHLPSFDEPVIPP